MVGGGIFAVLGLAVALAIRTHSNYFFNSRLIPFLISEQNFIKK